MNRRTDFGYGHDENSNAKICLSKYHTAADLRSQHNRERRLCKWNFLIIKADVFCYLQGNLGKPVSGTPEAIQNQRRSRRVIFAGTNSIKSRSSVRSEIIRQIHEYA